MSGFGYNVEDRIFQLCINFTWQYFSYKLENIVCGDVGEKILKIWDGVENEEQKREHGKGKAESHRTCSLADVIFLELCDEYPTNLINIF